MSDKIYLGPNVAELDYGDTLTRISRVNLAVDSDHIYTSGDDTGRTLEVDCPWGSQEMADSILAKVSTVDYQPYTAEQAILDPAAEVGDGVTVGGIYSQISTSNIEFDKMCVSDISAPESDEIDDEYPYESSTQRAIERKLAYTRSLITKTSEEIRLEVQGLGDKYTALSVTLDGVTVTDETGTTKIKGSSIETDTLYVNAANITGTLTADQIDATGLKVSAANITGTLTIGQLPSSVATTGEIPIYTSDLINDSGYQNSTQVTTITNNSISTATIKCSQIAAGMMTMTNGYLGDVTGSTGTEITEGVGMMSSASGASCVVTSAGARISYNSSHEIYIVPGKAVLKASDASLSWNSQGYFVADTEYCYLGSSSYPWNVIYSKDGTVQKSDRNQKENIVYGLEDYDSFFDGLKPVVYMFVGGKRKHTGLISQDVEEDLGANDLTAMDFAGFCKDEKADGSGYDYALRYDEFIALCIDQIQKLKKRVAELEGIS